MCRTFLTRHRTIARDRRGVAALEFGIIASTMVLLLLAAYDLGNAVYQRTVLAQAVRSAGQYALSFPTPSSGITTALTNTLPAHWTDASTSVSCTCVDGSGDSSSETDCDGCPSGTTERFITITASRTYSPFYFTAITGNSARYVVRIQ